TLRRCAPHLELLRREVHSGEQQRSERRNGPTPIPDPGLCQRTLQQIFQHCHAPFETEVMWRALRAAHEREGLAVCAHEGEVGLRVASVDREYDLAAHAAAATSLSSCSASCSTSAYC